MKRKNIKLMAIVLVFVMSMGLFSACSNTNMENNLGTEEQFSSETVKQPEKATYEEKTDVFLINNNVYGVEYSDGSSIDMNSLSPNGGKVITESEVNIYNQQKECIGYIKSGVTLTIATQSDEWSYVYVTDGGFIVRTESIKDLSLIRGNQSNSETTGVLPKVDDSTYTDTETNKTMYVKQNVNVRSGPSTDYGTVGSLNTNDEVIVTGESGTGWYQIKYNNGYAYVNAKYLSDTKTEVNTTPPNNGGNTNENENNSSDGIVPPTNNNIGSVPIEPETTPTPEPTYTYTVDEVIAIVESTLRSAGFIKPEEYMTQEQLEKYGPTDGMGWGIDKVPMNDPYTYANSMIEGFEYWGFNIYYLEYQGIENGCVVLKTYCGTLPQE